MITVGQPGASGLVTAQAYPNPADDVVCLVLPEAWALPLEAQLPAAAGRTFNPGVYDLNMPRGALQASVYSLKSPEQVPVRTEFC